MVISRLPPGGKGMIVRIGRLGKLCASAAGVIRKLEASATTHNIRYLMHMAISPEVSTRILLLMPEPVRDTVTRRRRPP
jgi:hypothetical protein